MTNQIYAQIEEDKDLSVITSVELKKFFPEKKVNNDRFHKRMKSFLKTCLYHILTKVWFSSILDQRSERNEVVCKSRKDKDGEEKTCLESNLIIKLQ